MAEGYAGTLAVLDSINNFAGWQSEAREIVRHDQWQEFMDVYVRDKHQLGLQRWFAQHNPHALAQGIERMLEAAPPVPVDQPRPRPAMSQTLELTLFTVAQLFLLPTLLLISLLFLYAFWVLGAFAMDAWRRRDPAQGGGRPLAALHRAGGPRGPGEDALDLAAHKLMEGPRIASRVTPLLGLVATMIPMGPALKGLSKGNLAQVSQNLGVALRSGDPGADCRGHHLLGGPCAPPLAGRGNAGDPGHAPGPAGRCPGHGRSRVMALKLLHKAERDDPILSVVNLIDIFLVIMAALLITVALNPLLSQIGRRDVTVITDAGKPGMEIVVKQGEKIEHYKASGQIGSGDGNKAGVAYRMKDGSIVYVPEGAP